MNPEETSERAIELDGINPGISRRVQIAFGALAALLLVISFVRPFVWPADGPGIEGDLDVVFVTNGDDTQRGLDKAAELVSQNPGSEIVELTESTDRADEARTIGELAEANGWDTIIVVTERQRVHHTRQLLGSCGPSGSIVVGVDSADGLLANLSEITSDATHGIAGSLREHC